MTTTLQSTTVPGFNPAKGAVSVRDVHCAPLPAVEQNPASDLISEIAPAVNRAAAKMAKTYLVRLSKGGVIQTCDLKNIAWVKVIVNLEAIAQKSADERAKYVYTIGVNAIRDEFRYISTDGDEALSLSSSGALSGVKDSSYDGDNDAVLSEVEPASESWTPPTIWSAWETLDGDQRYKLLKMAGLRGATVLAKDGPRVSCAKAKWSAIPLDYQLEIESAWKQEAKGALRRMKHESGNRPRNVFGFASDSLPAPTELARITPPKLRATALLVHGAGFITEGDDDSINSGKIAKILGRSERTIHRDNAELLKLWGAYSRADAAEKSDEEKFPRYPLHVDVAREFESIPDGAQMPQAQYPVLDDAMMTPGRLRSLRLRMKKYHTDFGSAVVTQTIVTPKANIYACGPDKVFKIIAGFENPVGVSEGHSRTIDCFWSGRGWTPIVCRDGVKQPIVWLHNWSASDAPELFGEKPNERKDDGRAPGAPVYAGVGLGESPARLLNTLTNGWGGCGGGSSIVTPQYFPLVTPLLGAAEQRAMFYRQAHKKPPFTRVGNWTQTRQLSPLYLTTQRSTSVALYPREQVEEKPTYCACELCKEMRKEDQRWFDYARAADIFRNLNESSLDYEPLKRNARRVGIMHGFDTLVGDERIRRTHFVFEIRGAELWTAEDFRKKIYVLTPPPSRPSYVESPYPHDWSDTVEVVETACIPPCKHVCKEACAARCLHAIKHSGKYAALAHRVLNHHRIDCSNDPLSPAEVAALYDKDERKKRADGQKAFAADNEAIRTYNAALCADPERLREADERIHEAILAVNGIEIAGVK
jgi:hypothetical protein